MQSLPSEHAPLYAVVQYLEVLTDIRENRRGRAEASVSRLRRCDAIDRALESREMRSVAIDERPRETGDRAGPRDDRDARRLRGIVQLGNGRYEEARVGKVEVMGADC
jgi:hypothetical protein